MHEGENPGEIRGHSEGEIREKKLENKPMEKITAKRANQTRWQHLPLTFDPLEIVKKESDQWVANSPLITLYVHNIHMNCVNLLQIFHKFFTNSSQIVVHKLTKWSVDVGYERNDFWQMILHTRSLLILFFYTKLYFSAESPCHRVALIPGWPTAFRS